ncbi:LPXTG cell wall anchor domain-containing protein [Limosilactobacillus caviae]|nr:LPXTG cell wall anchor domain-containing protein [Limosilactobacillus caviae]MCD7125007.1 LPXTG cell wall anchor domain-containing protein [Limosilactobacillus caviae]
MDYSINLVITWSADQTFNGVTTPKIPGYHVVSVDRDANGNDVASTPINHTGSDYTVTVTYAPDEKPQAENADLHIIDLSDNQKELANFKTSGDDNTAINFNGAQVTIDSLIKAGYKVNSIVQATSDPNNPTKYGTDYANAAGQWTFDDKPGVDQSFYVYLEHDYAPINPENAYGRTDLTQTVTETVHYVDEDTNKPVATDYTNTLTFKGQGRVDKVTGKMLKIKSIENGVITYDYDIANQIDISSAKLSDFAWSNPTTLAKVVSPTIAGYTIDAAKTTPSELADGNDIQEIQNVAYDHGNVEATVYYKANPVETHKAGLAIYADGKQVGTASDTGAKGTAINFGSASDIVSAYINNGYVFDHAQDVTNNVEMSGKSYSELNFGNFVTENNSNQQFAIYLTKQAPVAEQGSIKVTVHDVKTGQDVPGYEANSGTENVGTTFTYDTQGNITKLTNEGYKVLNPDITIPTHISKGDQSFVIYVDHTVVPVTPDKPGNGLNQDDLQKTVTETVHYVVNGGNAQAPADKTATLHFNGTAYYDSVTKKWTDASGNELKDQSQNITWTGQDGHQFDTVISPVVPGYHVTQVSDNYNDGNGNVKAIPGIDQNSANVNVTVTYDKDAEPVKDQGSIIVTIHDVTDNVDLPEYGKNTGTQDVGSNFEFNKTTTISDLESKGYKVLNPDVTIPTQVTKGDHSYTIYVQHNIVPVTPDKPGNGLNQDDLQKTVTETVHYVVNGGNAQAPADKTATLHFNGTAYYDSVTKKWTDADGKELSDQTQNITWTAQDGNKFSTVVTPYLDGYIASVQDGYDDGNKNVKEITGIDQNSANVNVSVTYIPVTPAKTQQNAQLTIRDATPGQEQDLGSYTQPGLEGDAISFGNAQEFVQNLLNKGYVWDGASYNGTNLDATNYAGINFGNYDNTDDKNGISQKWVINLVHGVTPVNPDHPDDKDGYTKEYLDRTITRDVTYVDEQGNVMPGLTPEHQEAKFQGSGYLDNVTGKWVTVENGKITGLADGLTWTPDTDANFDAIAAKTADGYHVISVSGNGISGFTVDANGAVTAQTVNRNTASSTIKVVYAKTPEVPVAANGSIVYIDDTTGNTLESASFGGSVGQKIDYTTADRIANYEGRGYKLVSNNFKDGNESFTNGENKFEVHLTHDTTTKDVTKTVTRDVTYVYEDGSQADTPVNQSFTFNGKTVTDRVTGAEKTSWDTDDHDFDATKSIDTTNYQIVGISKTNTTANVDRINGVVASETITPTSQNSSVVITLAKKVTPPTPVKQGTIEVIYHDTTDNVDIPGYGQPQTKEDQGTAFSYNPNAKDLPALEDNGYVLDGELPTIPTEYTDGNQRVVINVKHGTRPVTPENPANPTDPVDPQHPQTPTPSNPNLSKTDLEKTITRTVQYQYTDGTKAHADVVQTVNFTGEGTIDLVTGNLVTVDKDGNILNQRGKITWNHDSQDFANVAAIDHDGYYVSNITENGTTAKVDGTAVAGETVTPTSQNSTIVITLTKTPDVPVPANGSITYIDDTTGNVLASATFGGNVGQKINYTTADKIANYVSQGYNLVSNNFDDGNETFAKDGNVFEVHFVHATTPITPEKPGQPGQEVPNSNDPEHPHKIPANFVPQTLTNTVTRDVTYVYEDGSQAETPVHQTFTFTGNGVVDLVTGQLVTVENGKITGAGHVTWNAENHDFDATKAIDTTQYNIVKVSENNTIANVDMNNGVVAGETITPTSQNSSVVITLAKKPVTPTPVQKGTVIVNYVDKTTGKTLETATSTGNEGSNVDYSTKDTITKYTNQGYKLEHDGYPTGTVTYTNGTVTYEVNLVHDTVPVNPDQPGPKTPNTPINPDNPDGPKYPDGTQPEQLTKTITRTINYIGDGLNIPSVEKSLTFVANGVLDKVTGQWVTVDKDGKITGNANGMTWTVKDGDADEASFDEVAGPQTDGYHITNIAASNEDLSDINSSTGTVAGKTINHTNGNIAITINYAKNPVTPTPTPADQTVVGKQIVHYVDGDNSNAKLLDDNTNDMFVFTKSGKTGTWNADSYKYANANAPVIDGYVAEQKTYEGQTATPGDADKEITIVYHKIGKIIPVDPTGNPIPNAPTPGYHNDPTDPTKVTPNEPTPDVPGWTTNVPNVTPDTPTGDTKVPYTKPTPTQDKGSITITVHDVTDNTDLPEYGKTSGNQNVGTSFSYDKTGTFTSLTNKGYKVVNPDVTIPTGITKGDQNIVIYVEHTTTPITPENPGKPGQPINPNDPTGPQYPNGSDQVTKNVTRTITYVDNNGNKLHDPVEQTAHFTGTGVIDNVTGKWVTPITWTGNGDLNGQNTSVVDGYHADKAVANAPQADPDKDSVETITYAPNGHIIPVDQTGTPIPGADHPVYPTDPNDPTKVTPNEPVPTVPGYTPEQETVTPVDPGTNTPVIYDRGTTPVTPEQPETPGNPGGDDNETPNKVTPNTPANPGDNGNEEGKKVTPQTPQSPATPAENTPAASAEPQAPVAKQAAAQKPAVKSDAKTLPQTGNDENNSAAVLGLAALGLTGLVGLGKKRRKED